MREGCARKKKLMIERHILLFRIKWIPIYFLLFCVFDQQKSFLFWMCCRQRARRRGKLDFLVELTLQDLFSLFLWYVNTAAAFYILPSLLWNHVLAFSPSLSLHSMLIISFILIIISFHMDHFFIFVHKTHWRITCLLFKNYYTAPYKKKICKWIINF